MALTPRSVVPHHHEEDHMQQRPIGNRTVSAIGLGEMQLSIEGRPDRRQAIATIHASLEDRKSVV